MHKERHYISDKRNVNHFQKGALIFFYESQRNNGRAAIVAAARVKHAYLKPLSDLGISDFEQSVLDANSIDLIGKSPVKTVTVFDNLILLHKPVSLEFLKRIGCGRPTDLLTTRKLTNTQSAAILDEGFNHEE